MFYGVINEGYIFDSKDIGYQVEEFEQGKVKTLFVTGQSGSGKSTLGHKYEKELNIPCYELDLVLRNYYYSLEEMKSVGPDLFDFFVGEGSEYRLEKKPDKDPKTGKYNITYTPLECIKSFIEFIIKRNARCVVEGYYITVLLYEKMININIFKNSAIVIKGTSMVKSYYRSAKRDYLHDKEKDPNAKLSFEYLKNKLQYMLKEEKMSKKMRELIKKLKEG